ncbi:helix-turn-helix domain-containing protein [Streptantibioticus cattleyicolor]|nr:helix-turn-helix domain-containing protein [Streptantibioticus cattleyicolor]CCB71844.1 conserved protein of unknown function [Streptantibioticus cattleyicolor NRRL 8057 = DSM 46488]
MIPRSFPALGDRGGGARHRPADRRPDRAAPPGGPSAGHPLPAFLRARRLRSGLSQEGLAWRLDVSTRTVSNWERGQHGVDPRRVADLAAALALTREEERELAGLAGSRTPAARPAPAPETPHPGDPAGFAREWHRGFRDVGMPAYLRDPAWRLLACNAAYTRLFSGVARVPEAIPRENLARFICLHPDAPRLLADWYEGWLVPLLCEISDDLRAAPPRSPLYALLKAVLARPEIARAWRTEVPARAAARIRSAAAPEPAAPRHIVHPDPAVGRAAVHVSSMVPQGLDGHRSVFWRLQSLEAP